MPMAEILVPLGKPRTLLTLLIDDDSELRLAAANQDAYYEALVCHYEALVRQQDGIGRLQLPGPGTLRVMGSRPVCGENAAAGIGAAAFQEPSMW